MRSCETVAGVLSSVEEACRKAPLPARAFPAAGRMGALQGKRVGAAGAVPVSRGRNWLGCECVELGGLAART